MKLVVMWVMVFAFARAGCAMQISNHTNEKIWCSSICIKDQVPVEAMTQGWWEMANGANISVGNTENFVCNGYFCKGESGKTWTANNSGVQVGACVDFNKSPFKIYRANNQGECKRLNLGMVAFGLVQPNSNVELVP